MLIQAGISASFSKFGAGKALENLFTCSKSMMSHHFFGDARHDQLRQGAEICVEEL